MKKYIVTIKISKTGGYATEKVTANSSAEAIEKISRRGHPKTVTFSAKECK